MYDLVLQLILMISLSVIVYIMAAAVPRVEGHKGDDEESMSKNTVVLSLDKLDAYLEKLKDKVLRRIKLVVMRADNIISKELNKEE